MMNRMMTISGHQRADEIFACSEKKFLKCFGHLICIVHLPDDRIIICSVKHRGADLEEAKENLIVKMIQKIEEADEDEPILVGEN